MDELHCALFPTRGIDFLFAFGWKMAAAQSAQGGRGDTTEGCAKWAGCAPWQCRSAGDSWMCWHWSCSGVVQIGNDGVPLPLSSPTPGTDAPCRAQALHGRSCPFADTS